MGVLLNKEVQIDTIELKSGRTLRVKDHRGFTVFEVKANGDVYHKGKMVKT